MPSFQERLTGERVIREMQEQNAIVDPCGDVMPWKYTEEGLSALAELVRTERPFVMENTPMEASETSALTPQQQKCLSGQHEAAGPKNAFRFDLAQIWKPEGVAVITSAIAQICRHCRCLYVERA